MPGLSPGARLAKRGFDILAALAGLILTSWIIALAFVAASIDTRRNGFYTQIRVGRDGRPFRIIKLRTMRDAPAVTTTVTAADDPRISRFGRFLRRTKVDELPQLINVLLGQMSFVGPRPDVPGFTDQLAGTDRIILTVRPGITGPATLRFRHEEELLATQEDPETYNREVIFPEKVRLNCEYVKQYSFMRDIGYVVQTILGTFLHGLRWPVSPWRQTGDPCRSDQKRA